MARAIVCGSCVIDLPCLGVDLGKPIEPNQIRPIPPIEPVGGGLTCNTGFALQRLNIETSLLTILGCDAWGRLLREQMLHEGVNTDWVAEHDSAPTTAVVVLVDGEGERSFLAPQARTATKYIDAASVRRAMPAIAQADFFILGYYGRMPSLEPDLIEILQEIRATGCRTVLESAGDGGDPRQLQALLPEVDLFVPSEHEARQQTGADDPHDMLESLRAWSPHTLLGIKLGERGAILDHPNQERHHLPACTPQGPVVDTTGAGDVFLAGLVAGLIEGLPLFEAGRWAVAAGACAVTQRGAYHQLTRERLQEHLTLAKER